MLNCGVRAGDVVAILAEDVLLGPDGRRTRSATGRPWRDERRMKLGDGRVFFRGFASEWKVGGLARARNETIW